MNAQRQLIKQGTKRFTPIFVTEEDVIYDGNHGIRAAAEEGVTVDVEVIEATGTGFGNIMHVLVVAR